MSGAEAQLILSATANSISIAMFIWNVIKTFISYSKAKGGMLKVYQELQNLAESLQNILNQIKQNVESGRMSEITGKILLPLVRNMESTLAEVKQVITDGHPTTKLGVLWRSLRSASDQQKVITLKEEVWKCMRFLVMCDRSMATTHVIHTSPEPEEAQRQKLDSKEVKAQNLQRFKRTNQVLQEANRTIRVSPSEAKQHYNRAMEILNSIRTINPDTLVRKYSAKTVVSLELVRLHTGEKAKALLGQAMDYNNKAFIATNESNQHHDKTRVMLDRATIKFALATLLQNASDQISLLYRETFVLLQTGIDRLEFRCETAEEHELYGDFLHSCGTLVMRFTPGELDGFLNMTQLQDPDVYLNRADKAYKKAIQIMTVAADAGSLERLRRKEDATQKEREALAQKRAAGPLVSLLD
jgi:tetratricopeptide (TPR) repeat protein